MRLLAVEDEPDLGLLLCNALTRAGFTVDVVVGIADAEEYLRLATYDAMILDLGLADGDGLTLLHALRRRGGMIPVLILTARDAPEDRVTGLDTGADDYLIKPFHMPELISRVRALLRRPNAALGVVLDLGELVLDTVSRQAKVGETPLVLSLRETALLELLLRRQGNDVTQPVDLHAVAIEAISAMAPVALRHNVQLALSGQAITSAVTGNHVALVIALVNLLENALAHAPSQTLIELSLEPPARLAVLDRGRGVSEEERTVIFERFRRGRTEGSVGAGLGLAIVAGIAAAHHGSVQTIGRDGGGAAFVLELGTFA